MSRFRIIRGVHSEGGTTYISGVEGRDVIDSASDLSKHNFLGDVRFQPLPDLPASNTQAKEAQGDGLENLTIKELRDLAKTNDIDLGTATKHVELVEVIRGEMQLA